VSSVAGAPPAPTATSLPGTPTAAPGRAWPDLLLASTREVPQAASVIEIDLSHIVQRLEAVREPWSQRGLVPTTTPFMAEALLAALRSHPAANAAFDPAASAIRRFPAVHLGLSVRGDADGTARHGVIRDADTRNLLGLALEIQAIASSAGTDPAVLGEATVTLADYGPGAALFSVPLVLPGQSVAVRVGAVAERVLARERGFLLAPTAFVCLSIDHRTLDGLDAGALLGAMQQHLEREV
jgi:2-oxoisovalerate dehydrogenase E2 component (dihydrolipoyl transacylase)